MARQCVSVVLFVVFLLRLKEIESKYEPCVPRDFDHGSNVCICTKDYCDEFQKETKPLYKGQYKAYRSSKTGERFIERSGMMTSYNDVNFDSDILTVKVNPNVTYQTITGFGGAFTDSTCLHLYNMTKLDLREKLLSAYFSPESGMGFTIGRIPMASTDFSTRPYTYDDVKDDLQLKQFSLAKEDIDYKIPAIKEAIKYSHDKLILFGSPWTAPAWMKTNGKLTSAGRIRGQPGGKYFKAWAQYFSKFIDAYKSNGVDIWGVTVQNEPLFGLIPMLPLPTVGLTAAEERDFIKLDLGPTLNQSHPKVKLMIFDGFRLFMKRWARIVLGDREAKKYISGMAVHWYFDKYVPASFMSEVHDSSPDTFLMQTEASSGLFPPNKGPLLGSWERGEAFSRDIIEHMNHWSVGWVAWNLVLDMQGGPSWMNNILDAPVIVDYAKNVFYKQPTFYHIGHISHFVPPGSKRISHVVSRDTKLKIASFRAPDRSIVVVALNMNEAPQSVNICDVSEMCIQTTVNKRSIETYVWNEA